jgi:hypothetical protein
LPRRIGFNSRPVYLGFIAGQVKLGLVSLRGLRLSPARDFPPMLHTHTSFIYHWCYEPTNWQGPYTKTIKTFCFTSRSPSNRKLGSVIRIRISGLTLFHTMYYCRIYVLYVTLMTINTGNNSREIPERCTLTTVLWNTKFQVNLRETPYSFTGRVCTIKIKYCYVFHDGRYFKHLIYVGLNSLK